MALDRILDSAALLLSLGLALSAVGCSHKSPYYRADLISAIDLPQLEVPELSQRLILIGDAGKPREGEPVLATLSEWAAPAPEQTTVVFLGDNIYEVGMPDAAAPNRAEAERRLLAQIGPVATSGARGLFIPGNHDWGGGGTQGLAGILRQQSFVDAAFGDTTSFLPRDGCPGPVAVDLIGSGGAGAMRLIVLDTHWWFSDGIPASCEQDNLASVLAKLEKLAAEAGPATVVVLAHHPLRTHGIHGGFFDWRDHLFPLSRKVRWLWLPMPVVGSLYPIVRGSIFPSPEDLSSRPYRAMIDDLTQALSVHRPLVFAAGHDHSLQVMEGGEGAQFAIVSGLGSSVKASAVGSGPETLFAQVRPGFVVLDQTPQGRVLLRVVGPRDGIVFAKWL